MIITLINENQKLEFVESISGWSIKKHLNNEKFFIQFNGHTDKESLYFDRYPFSRTKDTVGHEYFICDFNHEDIKDGNYT